MADEVVHLIENNEAYGDTEVWCCESSPNKYSDLMAEVTCTGCLRQFLETAKVAQLRLAALDGST
jgi:hypothetical protein